MGTLKEEILEENPIGVSGVPILLNSTVGRKRKILWTLTLLVATITVVSLVVLVVQTFFLYPVTMNKQIINNEMQLLPYITVCPALRNHLDELDPNKIKYMYQNLTGTQMTNYSEARDFVMNNVDIEQVWKNGTWSVFDMMDECFLEKGTSCKNETHFTETFSIFGSCLTSKVSSVKMSGKYNGFYMKLKLPDITHHLVKPEFPLKGWKIYVHSDPIISHSTLYTNSMNLVPNSSKYISILMRKSKLLNTFRKPCVEDRNYSLGKCFADCLNNLFLNHTNCRFPFMEGNVSYCMGIKSYNETKNSVLGLIINGVYVPSDCNCSKPCQFIVPYLSGDTIENKEDNMGHFWLYYPDLYHEFVEEQYRYPAEDLISDFGSLLGLLLGASILSVCECFEFLLHYVHAVFTVRKQRAVVPQQK